MGGDADRRMWARLLLLAAYLVSSTAEGWFLSMLRGSTEVP